MKTTSVSFAVLAMFLPMLCQAGAEQPSAESVKPQAQNDKAEAKRPERQFLEVWKSADADQDGFISKSEFDLMPRIQGLPEDKRDPLFNRLDNDSDGKLSRQELLRFGRPRDDENEKPIKRLWELDADRSGGISFEELKEGALFKKLPEEKQRALFRRLDSNSDGVITPNDRPEPRFNRPEGKQKRERPDGFDPKRGEGPLQLIRMLDADGNGSLTFEEFRAGNLVKNLGEDEQEERFESLDRNGDQKISSEDFPPPTPSE